MYGCEYSRRGICISGGTFTMDLLLWVPECNISFQRDEFHFTEMSFISLKRNHFCVGFTYFMLDYVLGILHFPSLLLISDLLS